MLAMRRNWSRAVATAAAGGGAAAPVRSGLSMRSALPAATRVAVVRLYAAPQRAAGFSTTGTARASSDKGEKLFDKVLVANRGEIAERVFRTCRRLGIKTVAVYSDPDAAAVHTRAADEAVCVGPAASTESYLNIQRIVDACRETGAQAVHPGYGFLSENFEFAKALDEAGIAFIGPGEYALTQMGDKIASKLIAQEAKVNTIPGFAGTVDSDEDVIRISNEIGYPVMIKASAGGGGKGMRVAWNDDDAILGFRLSKEEAKSSFGDDRIFIEKFIEEPRHIEIQVLCDSHGNAVAFPERECSIQRRNQKVIEESPSVLLDEETRQAMGAQACALAKAVDYVSAGTVEFLCDKHKNFYFLEMNTRLQVEHPVTEEISGVDLVEQMLRVAAGHPLPDELLAGPIPINGWAIESRVYAEDPLRGFLPSTGSLTMYQPPVGEGVRCDTGVGEGSEISMFYDPMICKLVTHAPTREEARLRMLAALDSYVIRGVGHNANFCRDVVAAPRFAEGTITTGYIDEEYPDGFHGVQLKEGDRRTLIGVAAVMALQRDMCRAELSGRHDRASSGYSPTLFVTLDGGEAVGVTVVPSEDQWVVTPVDESGDAQEPIYVDDFYWLPGQPLLTLGDADADGLQETIQHLEARPEGFLLQYKGAVTDVVVRTPTQQRLSEFMLPKPEVDYSKLLVSPMPGVLVSLSVEVGDVVEVGQELAVVEAMKMQNVLRAAKKARVAALPNAAGATLAVDDIIVEFEDLE